MGGPREIGKEDWAGSGREERAMEGRKERRK